MTARKFKTNYFYAITENGRGEQRLVNLTIIFNQLVKIPPQDRILIEGEGNIQLKEIKYNEKIKRWSLCFLRNKIDAPFITKLSDKTNQAESLDDDEFVGQECCMLYDEKSKIIALQNNRASISFTGVSHFLSDYIEDKINLSAIVYKDKYTDISYDENINYKSVIIGYTDIKKILELDNMEDDESIEFLAKIANNLSAINGKIELNVGRTKKFLGKDSLKSIVDFFKRNKDVTNTIKVKMVEHDNVRLIDLINNKVYDNISIEISKNDPKTFNKILAAMNIRLDEALMKTFDKCKKFTEN